MKKVIFLIIFSFVFLCYGFSQAPEVNIRVDITNVAVNGGTIYLVFFSTAENFRNESPDYAFALQAQSGTVSQELSLPAGEYVISAFQDANNNQRLDSNFLGVPRELVGISNYFGRGLPSRNFDRQKIPINSSTGTVTIGLYRF